MIQGRMATSGKERMVTKDGRSHMRRQDIGDLDRGMIDTSQVRLEIPLKPAQMHVDSGASMKLKMTQ